jgi:hypothetical protein
VKSIRVSVAPGLEMLRTPIVVERENFRGLSIDSDLPHAYLGSNNVSIPEKHISTALLRKRFSRKHVLIHSTHYVDKEIYVKEIMMLSISVKKFLNVLMERLNLGLLNYLVYVQRKLNRTSKRTDI